jgi:PAS domain S-box-containing protein
MTRPDSTAGDIDAVDVKKRERVRGSPHLSMLREVREALSSSDDPDVIIQEAVDALSKHLGYTHVGAYLIRDDGLHLVHHVGYDNPATWLDLNTGICGRVARTDEAARVSDVLSDPDYIPVVETVRSEIAVPFGRGSDSSGVLNVEMAGPSTLTEADFRIVNEVGGLLSLAIERAAFSRAHRQSEQRLRLALDAAAMGVWTWTPASGALEWEFKAGNHDFDDGAIRLRTLDELLARSHAGDFAHLEHAFSRALIDGDMDVEFRLGDNGTAVRWLNLRGQVIDRAGDGSPSQIAGVVFDVTGRKRLEGERLRLVHLETARTNAEESQREMATTIERLRDGFVAIDSERRLSLVNEEAARLFGAKRSELLGSPLEEALGHFHDENAIANFVAACTIADPSAFDAYDPRTDRFLEVRVYPGSGGATLHLRDVTELRRAEYERQRSEAMFRSLVQHASDLILILDRRAVIQFASPAIDRMLGYLPVEVIGQDDKFPVHPDDEKRFRIALVRILRTSGTHPPFEVRVQHRNGSYRWLEITSTNLLSDPLIHGVVANCRDITERHASEFNLWLLSEVSTVMGASLDLDQTLQSLNRLLVTYVSEISLVAVFNERGDVERFGASRREPSRTPFGDGRDLADRAINAIGMRSGRSLSSRHTVVVDIARLNLDETDAPYTELGTRMIELGLSSAIVVPVVLRSQVRGVLMTGFGEGAGVTPALISMIEDVARRAGLAIENANLYQHARDAIEARDRFLSVAAHELRTPITSVTGYTAMLNRELGDRKDPVRISRYMGRLDEASVRLSTLAEDLLDVSRIRSGLLPLRMGPVDLGELTGQIVLRYAEQRSSARDRIALDSPGDPQIVQADPDRLEQVLTNVIDNALKYSPPDTVIEISIKRGEADVTLAVRDHGIGVARDNLERIFEPFGRAVNAEETGVTGLGLGLYICRTIIGRLGGSIWAESEGENAGLTVFVQLPLLSEQPEPAIVE